MLMARNVHMSTCSPGANSDGFMNMSPVSTSGRQTLALTFAATESEHPASATTGHSVHNADYLLMSCRVCSSGSAPRTASYGHRVACRTAGCQQRGFRASRFAPVTAGGSARRPVSSPAANPPEGCHSAHRAAAVPARAASSTRRSGLPAELGGGRHARVVTGSGRYRPQVPGRMVLPACPPAPGPQRSGQGSKVLDHYQDEDAEPDQDAGVAHGLLPP